FFQAEDGIRDGHVTGVQTCALPILRRRRVGSARTWKTSGITIYLAVVICRYARRFPGPGRPDPAPPHRRPPRGGTLGQRAGGAGRYRPAGCLAAACDPGRRRLRDRPARWPQTAVLASSGAIPC